MDENAMSKLDWKPFNDAFEEEIGAQEFAIDEGEWMAIIKALKVAQEAMEGSIE